MAGKLPILRKATTFITTKPIHPIYQNAFRNNFGNRNLKTKNDSFDCLKQKRNFFLWFLMLNIRYRPAPGHQLNLRRYLAGSSNFFHDILWSMKSFRFFVQGYQEIENWPKNLFFKKGRNIFRHIDSE